MNWNFFIPVILSLLLLVPYGQAMGKEELVPSLDEIQSLFDPYSLKPYGEPLISDNSIDIAYTYYQSKSYNPPREQARIFFRIAVHEFEPKAHDGEVAAIKQTIKESNGDPASGYGKKELIDIGEIGYYQDIFDTYAGGSPIGCEIEYVTRNYRIWCAYNRKVDPEGFDKNYEDPHVYLQRCVNILKAPEGNPEIPEIVDQPFQALYPEILMDGSENLPGTPFSLTIRVSDQNGNKIADVDGSIIFSSGSDSLIPTPSFTTDSSGNSVITDVWPEKWDGRIWIRVEVEKRGYEPGSDEISVSLHTKPQPDLFPSDNNGEQPKDQIQEYNIRIGLLPVIQESGLLILGKSEILQDGTYVQWHPQVGRVCIIKVVIPDESGVLRAIEMTAPFEPDGTFRIPHPDPLLVNAILTGKSREMPDYEVEIPEIAG